MKNRYRLSYFHQLSGMDVIPTATVEVQFDDRSERRVEYGVGPADAIFKAIKNATGENCQLLSFGIEAIGSNSDAEGETIVRVRKGSHVAHGRSKNVDIMRASAEAYVDALNKLDKLDKRKENAGCPDYPITDSGAANFVFPEN